MSADAGRSRTSAASVERVRAFCRLRPRIAQDAELEAAAGTGADGGGQSEGGAGGAFVTETPAPGSCVEGGEDAGSVAVRGADGKAHQFQFDQFFPPEATQEEVYRACAAPVVESVVGGYHGTIFAYGQTGTGKTHTMLGPSVEGDGGQESAGLTPRCLEDLLAGLRRMEAEDGWSWRVEASYVQIYCELVTDLLDPAGQPLRIREDASGEVYVEGVTSRQVAEVRDGMELLREGARNRAVADTRMNAESSRSHAALLLRVERRRREQEQGREGGGARHRVVRGQLFLVDLAGSERVGKTGVRGAQLSELRAINLSLSALGNCIGALSEGRLRHVPYRDSKLTRLLQNSLGGEAKTSLVVTAGPSRANVGETLSALSFGQRAMRVKVKARVHEEVDYRTLYERAEAQLQSRDDEVNTLQLQLQRVTAERDGLKRSEAECRRERDRYREELEAMRPAADGEISEGDTPQALREAHEREVQAMREAHEKERVELQAKASRAQEEWHRIESDLYHVKSAHLEALQELRSVREAQVQTERELTERVAELSDELRERTEELDLTVDALEEKEKECAAKEAALQNTTQEADRRASAKVEHARKQLDRDYVSRATVRQMEKLYDQALSRLVRRVEELERRNGGGHTGQQGATNGASADAKRGAGAADPEAMAADRKLAEVARRPPPGRRPQARMQPSTNRTGGPVRRGARGGQGTRATASAPSLPPQGLSAYRSVQGPGSVARRRTGQPRRWAAPRGSEAARGRTAGARR